MGQAHRLGGVEKSREALALLQRGLRENPGFVLGLEVARRSAAAGDRVAAGRSVEFAAAQIAFTTGDLPLAHAAAKVLAEGGAAPKAVLVYRAILRNGALTREWRATVLHDARDAARAGGDPAQAIAWEKELAELTTPASPEGKR